MAKKKQNVENAKNAKTFMDMVKEAFIDLGDAATSPQIREWLDDHYPNLTYSKGSFAGVLWQVRKAKGIRIRNYSRDSVRHGFITVREQNTNKKQGVITLNMLMAVKQAAKKAKGMDKLREQVNKIKELSQEAGGIDNLVACMDAFDDLFPKK